MFSSVLCLWIMYELDYSVCACPGPTVGTRLVFADEIISARIGWDERLLLPHAYGAEVECQWTDGSPAFTLSYARSSVFLVPLCPVRWLGPRR